MDKFVMYLNETVEKLKSKEEELRLSDRKDESNFVKIQINICEVSKSVYQVVVKQEDTSGCKDAYLNKMNNISSSWIAAYEKAKEHQDINKILIEKTKLEMLEEIKRNFFELV